MVEDVLAIGSSFDTFGVEVRRVVWAIVFILTRNPTRISANGVDWKI